MTYLNFLLVILAYNAISAMAADWSYEGDNGPENWSKHFPLCGGKRQSPVDIEPEMTRFWKRKLRHNYAGKHPQLNFTLENNGHAAQVTLANTDGLYAKVGRDRFKPLQVHFHWGSKNSVGSEHTVDGDQYAAEMHFVHMNQKYPSQDEAVKHWDGLLVLGTFIEVEKKNDDLDPIFIELDKIKNQGQKVPVSDLDISKLMPSNTKDFFFYSGSLTTPTCNQAVKWIVFADSISISEGQISLLRSLTDNGGESLVNNFRPTQPLNRRGIYRTFKDEEE